MGPEVDVIPGIRVCDVVDGISVKEGFDVSIDVDVDFEASVDEDNDTEAVTVANMLSVAIERTVTVNKLDVSA